MNLNEIRDDVINRYCQPILKQNTKAASSKRQWQTKSFIRELLIDDNFKAVDFFELIPALYREVSNHLLVSFSESQIRGKLRNAPTISEKAFRKAMDGKVLEVPLERSLAMVNNWFCQFSTLSGFRNEPHTYKRKSIDLVVPDEENTDSGYLIELKEWNNDRDHVLFAAMEVIIYWFCFVIVRDIDSSQMGHSGYRWPDWTDFKLRVMAPEEYFQRQPDNYSVLPCILNDTLGILVREATKSGTMKHVSSCRLDFISLKLTRREFKDFLRSNESVITRSTKGNAPLRNKQALTCRLR